jgi:CheY-like chemotaxis protein
MKKRLLWIEDDASELHALVSGLGKTGWDIETATTEAEANTIIDRGEHWDAILLDIILPEEENPTQESLLKEHARPFIGLDLLTRINNKYGASRPPVVAITKVTDEVVRQRLNELKADRILTKGSLVPKEVTDAVRQLVRSDGSESD